MDEYLKKAMIKLMVTVVDRGHGEKITKIFNKENVHFHFICFGDGTASSEILDYLGLGSSEKDVVFSMVPACKVQPLFEAVTYKLSINKPGRGIMFTMPLSGIASKISKILNQEVKQELEQEIEKIKCTVKNDLVLAIVNQGYAEQLMTAAREAGARGGTILHARGVGAEEAKNYLGVSIQAEKEMVMILTPREQKAAIMDKINKEIGIKTEAKGIVFSLPVDNIEGIQF